MIEINTQVKPGFSKVNTTAPASFYPKFLSTSTPNSPIQLQNVTVNEESIFHTPDGIDLEETPFGPSLLCMTKSQDNPSGSLPINWQRISEGDEVSVWVFNTAPDEQVFSLNIMEELPEM